MAMKPLYLPWRGRKVPMAMLDVIRGCNCVCRACANHRTAEVKPLDEIKRELDTLLSLREVETVGISGGEPLLHPDVVAIVKLIAAAGVRPSLFTNGILWTPAVARELAEAGLGMVAFHVQVGQRRPDLDPTEGEAGVARLLEEKCAQAHAAGIESALLATMSLARPDEVVKALETFRRCRFCPVFWMTVEQDVQALDLGQPGRSTGSDLDQLTQLVASQGWLPFGGTGGHVDPKRFRWLAYHAYRRVNEAGEVTDFVSVPPSWLERSVLSACRVFNLRLRARQRPPRWAILARIALNALLGGAVGNLKFVVRAVLTRERIEPKYLVAEVFPEILDDGRIEFCNPCMDAAVYGDHLVPPCLADTHYVREGLVRA